MVQNNETTMALPLYIVDAFTPTPFGGNPAAVCVMDHAREPAWMQSLAAEMNLSETAFLLREGEAWNLRWFTPKIEVDLCGHATLASAHILWERGFAPADRPAVFHTRSGMLTCARRDDWIEMDFPVEPPVDGGEPGNLLAALGAPGSVVGRKRNRMDYLVELANEQAVRALAPNMALLEKIPVRGVIVTARSDDSKFDFVSRFFAPAAGVNEDPVTGSAHCCLAPYWAAKLGKTEMVGYQASQRGGVVRVKLQGDRVILGGQAATVLRAELLADETAAR
jgi:predicted PhzF superfamily epimerase YddE/YHI9